MVTGPGPGLWLAALSPLSLAPGQKSPGDWAPTGWCSLLISSPHPLPPSPHPHHQRRQVHRVLGWHLNWAHNPPGSQYALCNRLWRYPWNAHVDVILFDFCLHFTLRRYYTILILVWSLVRSALVGVVIVTEVWSTGWHFNSLKNPFLSPKIYLAAWQIVSGIVSAITLIWWGFLVMWMKTFYELSINSCSLGQIARQQSHRFPCAECINNDRNNEKCVNMCKYKMPPLLWYADTSVQYVQ